MASSSKTSNTISAKRQRQLLVVLLGAFSLLAIASLATHHAAEPFWSGDNACGPVGATIATGLVFVFGRVASFLVPVLGLAWAWNRFREHEMKPLVLKSVLGTLLLFELCLVFALAGLPREVWAGGWGAGAGAGLHAVLGNVGAWVVALALFAATALVASEMGFHWIAHLMHGALVKPAQGAAAAYASWQENRAEAAAATAKQRAKDEKEARKKPKVVVPPAIDEARAANEPRVPERPAKAEPAPAPVAETPNKAGIPVPVIKAPPKPKPRAAEPPRPSGPVPTEALPPFSILDLPQQPEDLVTASDLTAQANLLVAKLADFDIDGRVTEIHPGPVVTMFEFEPAAGIKVGSIVSLEDDLALAMKASRIRVIAPLPGRGTVGVEIPNPRRRTVYLREVLSSTPYEKSDAALKIPLGVDVNGQPFVTDLAKMPHVLVAGATGAGKSVCLNSIITGLLFQHEPNTLQMVMVDPKMVELSMYNGIPHLVMPVVTEAKKAARALRWAVGEMEKRYKLLSDVGARNITTYNERVASGKLKVEGEEKPPERLSYVMVIVDEFADLMVQVPGEVEEPIARLAQMARAVGIHLVLATQRPSVDVITGVIKANFPSRIAFRVASKVDSRTVLDMNGAENLLGMGDMLFLPAGKAEPYRVHGAYVSEEEAVRVVDFWRAKATVAAAVPPPLATEVVLPESDDEAEGGDDFMDDELIPEAAKLVVMHNQGSTSLLQRRLKVGYSRAGRLMDQLEQLGVVGPFNGSKARDVLVDQHWLQQKGFE